METTDANRFSGLVALVRHASGISTFFQFCVQSVDSAGCIINHPSRLRTSSISDETTGDHFKSLFEYAPISLWEEDFSGVKTSLDGLRANGVTDLAHYLDERPEEIENNMQFNTVAAKKIWLVANDDLIT